jgi:hypothetical protein
VASSVVVYPSEQELLDAKAYAISTSKLGCPFDGSSVHPDAIATAQVFYLHPLVAYDEARVVSRHERILDGQMAFDTPSDESDSVRQVELLQQEPQSVSRQG